MKVQVKEIKLTTWTFIAQVPHIKVMVARFQFKALFSSIALASMVAYIASPSVIYGGLIMS